jgi:hypothetical protein
VVAPISSRRDLDDSCRYLKVVRKKIRNKIFQFSHKKMETKVKQNGAHFKHKKNTKIGRRTKAVECDERSGTGPTPEKKQKHFVPVR